MSTNTINYELMMLDQTDFDTIANFNRNAVKIDTALKENHNAQQEHNTDTNNPHNVKKEQIGLGNVDNTSDVEKPISNAQQAALDGKADLGADGKIPESQLPSYVDDVLEFEALSSFPEVGETGKIYVDLTTNLTYRWSGSAYVEISPSLALGETASTAYRGDRGKAAYDHAQSLHARTDATKTEPSTKPGCIKINGQDIEVFSSSAVVDLIYPVGSIFVTIDGRNPKTYMGGTWEPWGEGRMIMGIGSQKQNTYTGHGTVAAGSVNHTLPETMGGSHQATMPRHTHTTPAHSHTITGGGHQHSVKRYNTSADGGVTRAGFNFMEGTETAFINAVNGNHSHTVSGGNGTSGEAAGVETNYSPYITAFLWKRTK